MQFPNELICMRKVKQRLHTLCGRRRVWAGKEADGRGRCPLFSRHVSLDSFCSSANRVRDEKQTQELCLNPVVCTYSSHSGRDVCVQRRQLWIQLCGWCTFPNILCTRSSAAWGGWFHPALTQSMWCWVSEQSPAGVCGEVRKVGVGARLEVFLVSPPLMIKPAQGDHAFALLWPSHLSAHLCGPKKSSYCIRDQPPCYLIWGSSTIRWEISSHGEVSSISGSISPPTLFHSYETNSNKGNQ